jgi:hypothetical protein
MSLLVGEHGFVTPTYTPSDRDEANQSLVIGRRALEFLVAGYRAGAPESTIADLERRLAAASSHELRSANDLNTEYRREGSECTAIHGYELPDLLYEIAAHGMVLPSGTAEQQAEYLATAKSAHFGYGNGRLITSGDPFVDAIIEMLREVADPGGVPYRPVGNARRILENRSGQLTAGDNSLWRLCELYGMVAEVAAFREARDGTLPGAELRARLWRNRAIRAYATATYHAHDPDDKERLIHSHAANRGELLSHLQPYGRAAWAIATSGSEHFLPDFLEAIDAAQVRSSFASRGEGGLHGEAAGFGGPDLVLGLYLSRAGRAHQVLASLGVGEPKLREIVRQVNSTLSRGMTVVEFSRVLQTAKRYAHRSGHSRAGSEHLLHALIPTDHTTPATQILARFGVTPQRAGQAIVTIPPAVQRSVAM